MEQRQIMALLFEASSPDCTPRERAGIQVKLADSVNPLWGDKGRNILDGLFGETACNKPEYLPMLFPAFVVLCGDKDDINWNLCCRR